MGVKKNNIKRIVKVSFFIGLGVAIIGVLVFVTVGNPVPVLQPSGLIANQERDLIILLFSVGLLVVIPVFILLFTVAWRYRATNTKAKYEPEYVGNKGMEITWWGIPFAIIVFIAVVTTITAHSLDPYKPINSVVKPVNIQVIALDWKWLFIYPDYGIATLNYANVPIATPINLQITSDAPMNSFWIPALSGQIYAMPGMSTKLHLMADEVGSYNGASANISGEGFAGMSFKMNSMSSQDFALWAESAKMSDNMLTGNEYDELTKPSINEQKATYMLMDNNLYNDSIMKYMMPQHSHGMSM